MAEKKLIKGTPLSPTAVRNLVNEGNSVSFMYSVLDKKKYGVDNVRLADCLLGRLRLMSARYRVRLEALPDFVEELEVDGKKANKNLIVQLELDREGLSFFEEVAKGRHLFQGEEELKKGCDILDDLKRLRTRINIVLNGGTAIIL